MVYASGIRVAAAPPVDNEIKTVTLWEAAAGEWIRYADIEQALGWDCDCDGGDQGDGLCALPHADTCPVAVRQKR